MKTNVLIELNAPYLNVSNKWYTSKSGVSVCGFIFDLNGSLLSGSSLADYFSVSSHYEFQQKLAEANGFFAVVIEKKDVVFFAVDRMRSIPIFYSYSKNNKLVISDSAESVRNILGIREIDSLARDEFLQAGFVLDNRTLITQIYQLLAGEFLVINLESEELIKDRYYFFWPEEIETQSENNLLKKLDSIYEKVFDRLLAWLNNRLAVIPLSGGFDSRLIAFFLKRKGYEKVFCFTYDVGSTKWETHISEIVAKKLGYPWLCVNYDLLTSRKVFQSKDMKRYRFYAANWCSLPHRQDWLAINYLLNKGFITPDSAVISGVGAGTVTGAFSGEYSGDKLPHYIQKRWMHLRSSKIDFTGSIKSSLKNFTDNQLSDSNLLMEAWEWQERECKFITNSVRVYDWHNLDWYLPYCDRELMDFWAAVPQKLRFRKQFHKNYVVGLDDSLPLPNSMFVDKNIRKLKRFIDNFSLYSLPEHLQIIKDASFLPREYFKMMNYNGSDALNVFKLLEEVIINPQNHNY